jgi:hypothetical protein
MFRRAGNVFQYLYFMRFSLLIWAALILLPLFDWAGWTASITRGMFALEYSPGMSKLGQFIWAGFHVFLWGWFALLSARVVAAYGPERFRAEPPEAWQVRTLHLGPEGNRLTISPGEESLGMRWRVFWGAQIPGALFLLYTIYKSIYESSERAGWFMTVLGVALGAGFALIAWYLMTFIYHFRRDPNSPDGQFHSFFLPTFRWRWLREPLETALHDDAAPPLDKFADRIMREVARIGPGYDRTIGTGNLHSGQGLAIELTFLLLAVYVTRGLLKPPVPLQVFWENHRVVVSIWGVVSVLLLAAFAVLPLWSTFFSSSTKGQSRAYRLKMLAVLVGASIVFFGLVRSAAFPVLLAVFSLLILFCWVGGGLAFFGDRFRIPVVTVMLWLVILGTWVFAQDHIYRTLSDKNSVALDQMLKPKEVIRNFRELHPEEPMIVVTASGGGIHAAAWTATVLDGLEQGFAGAGFHQHVLLMSSVSGGSVPTSYWAESYLDATTSGAFRVNGIKDMAQSSSLEDAAWGVLYPDLNHLLVWKDIVFPSLREFDRGWALQEAFERIRSEYRPCKNHGEPPCFPDGYTLAALRDHILSAKDLNSVPAFAFNTTLAGTGQRFLLSNYTLPTDPPAAAEGEANALPPPVWHAPNFLKFYPGLDLPLSAAARLSATFSYVSPVAAAMCPSGCVMDEHLADGGYYDNDGMATALEFLSSAYGGDLSPESKPPQQEAASAKPNPQVKESTPSQADRIFLIEIRHSDLDHPVQRASTQPPVNPALGQVAAQTVAPINTVFGAWDTAQGFRNQREFALLKSALQGKVVLRHFIYTYFDEMKRASPLSWHLTERDKQDIAHEWGRYSGALTHLVNCFNASIKTGAAKAGADTQKDARAEASAACDSWR